MRRFESLLIDRANLRVPGLHVQTFAVHRHLPEHDSVAAHRHPWSQAILYLSGAGIQTIGTARARIGPGTLVLLAPGQPHAFERREGRPPQCVLIDFRLRGSRAKRSVVCGLNRSDLAEIQRCVSHVQRLQAGAGPALKFEGAIPVLQVLLVVLRAAGWLPRDQAEQGSSRRAALAPLLGALLDRPTLAAAIRQSGYQRDHLNRLVKKETGLTLGQYRAQLRLAKAKELLGGGIRVADIAATVGLPDQGYFARWFRRQTGQSPSDWRRDHRRTSTG